MNTSPSSVVQQKPGAKQRFQPGCGRWKKGGNKGEASEDKSKTLEGPTPPPFPFFLFLCLSVFSKRKQVVQDRATSFFSLFCTVAVITWVSQTKLGN